MEQVFEELQPRLGFELRMKEGKELPKEYVLFIGLKASGAVLAKSIEGVIVIPWGEVGFKHGGSFAKIFVIPSKSLVVLSAEADLHYEQTQVAIQIAADFLQGATKTIIVESVPWAMMRTWGHSEFELGLPEGQDYIASYDKAESIPVDLTLGKSIFTELKSKPVKYYLQILVENATNYSDCKLLADELSKNESLTFVETKIRSAVKTALQSSSYI